MMVFILCHLLSPLMHCFVRRIHFTYGITDYVIHLIQFFSILFQLSCYLVISIKWGCVILVVRLIHTKLPFDLSSSTVNKPLELVHSDVWGPSLIVSHTGFQYYVLFSDQYSRFSWIYFCSNKGEVSSLFEQFKALAEILLSTHIKTMQIDGGIEFKPII
jgi:hypothetical protein